MSGLSAMSRVTKAPTDYSDDHYRMTGLTAFISIGCTVASSQGEESMREVSLTLDPSRLGTRPNNPMAPTFVMINEESTVEKKEKTFEEETENLSEKVATEDLVTKTLNMSRL